MMRAVVCQEVGSLASLRVVEQPMPSVAANQLLVEVRAVGTSFVDALQVSGKYQFPIPAPYTPGGECAGVVVGVGDDLSSERLGQSVAVSCGIGAYASHVLVSEPQAMPLPAGVSFDVGATFLQVYGTAWFAFHHRTQIAPGETVLVTGAGGGVGLAAIDVARHLGAKVIAVASTSEKRAAASAAGAFATIDTADDVKTRARELTGGKGVDVVYDVTGGPVAEQALRALSFDGRYLVVGFTAGIERVPLNLVLLNNRAVIGVEWGGWIPRHRDENAQMIRHILEAIGEGALSPVVPSRRPLADAPLVLSDLLERRAVGKIALIP
jgi:NADPH:quinone reductase